MREDAGITVGTVDGRICPRAASAAEESHQMNKNANNAAKAIKIHNARFLDILPAFMMASPLSWKNRMALQN